MILYCACAHTSQKDNAVSATSLWTLKYRKVPIVSSIFPFQYRMWIFTKTEGEGGGGGGGVRLDGGGGVEECFNRYRPFTRQFVVNIYVELYQIKP